MKKTIKQLEAEIRELKITVRMDSEDFQRQCQRAEDAISRATQLEVELHDKSVEYRDARSAVFKDAIVDNGIERAIHLAMMHGWDMRKFEMTSTNMWSSINSSLSRNASNKVAADRIAAAAK